MKFDHMVKYNDRYYMAGEDVPIGQKEQARAEDTPLPLSDSDITLETDSAVRPKKYTKTDINRMDKAELQTLATENGVENAYDMTGTELKSLLAEMLVK